MYFYLRLHLLLQLNSVVAAGATPVFVDITKLTNTIDTGDSC